MEKLPDMEAWAIFAHVAATGSFSAAAAALGLSKSSVSKAIARLETRLGAKLMHRTSRKLSLTEAGQRLAVEARHLLAQATALERDAAAEAEAPAGLVRIAAPMSFGVAHVAPLMPALLAAHPALTIDLHLSDAVTDLTGDGFDLAVRIAALADSSLRARRICRVQRFLVAAPSYLERHGTPGHPGDLARHACLGYAYLATGTTWHFVDQAGTEASVKTRGPLRANNGEALAPALRAGLGLAVAPEFSICEDMSAGRLVHVMPGWSPPPVALSIVTSPGALRARRVSAVIEFFAARLAAAAWARAPG